MNFHIKITQQRTRWRLFQKRVVRTNLDIYVLLQWTDILTEF